MSKEYTLEESWTIRGRYYGFPECCIESFLTLSHVSGPDRKLDGTGYVPCLKCNEKSEEELIQIINSNRRSPRPFPEDNWDLDEAHIGEILQELIDE